MRKIRSFFSVLFFFIFGMPFVHAQEFTRFFLDTAEIQTANNLIREPSGKLWLGGTKLPLGADELVAWLYHLEADGEITKRIRFPISGYQSWVGMELLDNGQVALVIGQRLSTGITENWLALVDSTHLISFRKIEGLDNAILDDVNRTKSGKLLVCGFRPGPDPQGNNFFLTKVNPETAQNEWIYEESLSYTEHVSDAIESKDGTILFCGDIQNSSYNPYVVRLDSNGNFIWDLIIATPWNDGSQTIAEDSIGRIWLVGESSTSAGSMFDTELNIISSTGQLLWQQWLGSPGQDAAFLIKKAQQNGFWVGGYSNAGSNGIGPISPFLMRLDNSGTSLGEKFWPFPSPSPVYDMAIIGDSTFYFCGISNTVAYLMRRENPVLENVFTVPVLGLRKIKNDWTYNRELQILQGPEMAKNKVRLMDLHGRVLIEKVENNALIQLKGIPTGIYLIHEMDLEGQSRAQLFRKD